MARLSCVKCKVFLEPKRGNVGVMEMLGRQPETGGQQKAIGGPNRLWEGTVWECPSCHCQIAVIDPDRPMIERDDPRFFKIYVALHDEGRLYEASYGGGGGERPNHG